MNANFAKRQPKLIPFEGDLSVVGDVVKIITAAGGCALLVGGCVRDALLGVHSKDVDIEVQGLSAPVLRRILKQRFDIVSVGQSFGVFKIRGHDVDVSLPRRESKTGLGHRGFRVEGDPNMPLVEAAARRDFTINAIYWNPRTGELLDPYGGIGDLAAKRLRHTSPAFADDPLRVLRGMQFAARFQMTPAPETVELCSRITPENLPPERIFEEWSKFISKGVKPSIGLTFLRNCGWVRYYPELEALIGCEQDPIHHPEGDVWTHTAHCLDAFAANRTGDVWEDLVVGFAVLCHDFGKAVTTRIGEDGRLHAYGHEEESVPLARAFLMRMTQHRELIESVLPLVENHMCPFSLWRDNAGNASIRRLARRVGRIDRLVRVGDADQRGRPPLTDFPPCGKWLLEKAAALRVEDTAPKPILLGRHLIKEGIKPGPDFSKWLKSAFEAQIEGAFSDEIGAITWLRQQEGFPPV
ncbi:MAG: polynucleotide adenylyltransferase [Puniceicoccales bacterium]|nr:polynucleotide adenylyltransferase [Puniceicoccales bacterium]